MPGLTIVAERLFEIAQSARLASSAIREAADEARSYKAEVTKAAETSSGVASAGGGTSTMGATQAGAVDTNGLGAALQITRGRL